MKVIKSRALFAALLAFILGTPVTGIALPSTEYAPDEVLIGYRRGADVFERSNALTAVGGIRVENLATAQDLSRGEVGVDRVKIQVPVPFAIEALKNNRAVAFAEPNYIVQRTATSDDPRYVIGDLWGAYGNDAPHCGPLPTSNLYGTDAEEAWYLGQTGSSDVYVGILDGGVQVTHPDLVENIWVNPFDPIDGQDNDGNGYIDDVNGWDFFNEDNSVMEGDSSDNHATHVAGTIGARGGNGIGTTGINWKVKIIPVKFIGPQTGYTSDIVNALNYLRDLKARHGLKIVATNNSYGGGGYSTSLHSTIIRAAKEGILFVASAGNAAIDNDATAKYPANYSTLEDTYLESAADYEAVTSVASIDSTGDRSWFSNFGLTTVDLGAPGSDILSTVPTDDYGAYSGTSMAAPHVTGAIALYASAYPAATAAQIRSTLLANTSRTPSLVGYTVTGGRLNLQGLFGPPPPVRDGALISMRASKWVRRNKSASITVELRNEGELLETFSVALTASGGRVSPAKKVKLKRGAKARIGFSWRAPTVRGIYTLTVSAAALPNETDIADNELSASIEVR